MNPIRYVTYTADGTLDGCFFQVPAGDHVGRTIEVDETVAGNWPTYRANDARDGVELMPAVVPLVDLEAVRTAAIAQTYADVDAIIAAAVGNRVEEYRDAESAARAYVAAGYSGDVDRSVSTYAQYNPTGQVQTNQWAADQIIARADVFRSAQLDMRDQRFISQAGMRTATTQTELQAAIDTWGKFITDTRANLELA